MRACLSERSWSSKRAVSQTRLCDQRNKANQRCCYGARRDHGSSGECRAGQGEGAQTDGNRCATDNVIGLGLFD